MNFENLFKAPLLKNCEVVKGKTNLIRLKQPILDSIYNNERKEQTEFERILVNPKSTWQIK